MNHEGTKARREPMPPAVERVASKIIDAAFQIHSKLGPGLLESVYQRLMAYELSKRGLNFEQQAVVPIIYEGIRIESGLRVDLVVEDCVVVELKCVESFLPVHEAQALTYLKVTGLRLALLINFNVPLIRSGIKQVVL